MSAQVHSCTPFRLLPSAAKAVVIGIGLVFAGLCVFLWPSWEHDPDLSHGFFVPILSVLLVTEARRSAEGGFGGRSAAAALVLCAGALSALVAAGVYAAVLDWSHSLVGSLAALTCCLLGLAAWLGLSENATRWIPRNWPALAAILLWGLAAPLPPGTYARLSGLLQSSVISVVMTTLHVCGIAAYREGNVIELARATVGVSEACSGVRSLLSSTAAALFLSAFVTTRTRSRIALVLAGPAIALLMNYLRSLILTIVASQGIDIEGRWHDWTGTAIIVVTSALLLILALWIDRAYPPAARTGAGPALPGGSAAALRVVVASLVVLAVVAALFVRATHPFEVSKAKALDLDALLPGPPAGWILYPEGDLKQYADILRTDTLASRTYIRRDGASFDQVTIYLAYWTPGQAPVSLVASHTPDACWPGTGWVSEPIAQQHASLRACGRMLPQAESRIFVNDTNGFRENVWFWHLYGGRPLAYQDPYAFSRLFGLALQYGFQHERDQLFIRVSSNRPWSEIAQGPILGQFFASVKPLGL